MIPGMGGMDPKQMAKMMKQMGIDTSTINAKKVIIELEEKTLEIANPQVVKVSMQGQDTFQVSGTITEVAKISAEDVKMVAEQAGVPEDEAKKALEGAGGDIAQAILNLQNENTE
ncbi:nascent polypeptide-associated complex protein [Candidatus Micrarchaeota archaeon CG10_big_fil_rev_8_21_14_0_10_45_29]|nr:MAG: nascent polypeptide-associated complex protein [Candidatus Micrarchaeota archaeon CG10_big_fil_rev_8_21_14_0_10_45_29]